MAFVLVMDIVIGHYRTDFRDDHSTFSIYTRNCIESTARVMLDGSLYNALLALGGLSLREVTGDVVTVKAYTIFRIPFATITFRMTGDDACSWPATMRHGS
jgi:hypothetical protein